MLNTKQKLINEMLKEVTEKEKEIENSNEEVRILKVRIKIENKALEMKDLKEDLREDFVYGAEALKSMLTMEENRNFELKRELEVLKYRKAVIESQFTDSELD